MRSWRVRLAVAALAVILLAGLGWYQQRTILCEDALARRRNPSDAISDIVALRDAEGDVGRFCFTWVGRSLAQGLPRLH